jgi:hypothetical protein
VDGIEIVSTIEFLQLCDLRGCKLQERRAITGHYLPALALPPQAISNAN